MEIKIILMKVENKPKGNAREVKEKMINLEEKIKQIKNEFEEEEMSKIKSEIEQVKQEKESLDNDMRKYLRCIDGWLSGKDIDFFCRITGKEDNLYEIDDYNKHIEKLIGSYLNLEFIGVIDKEHKGRCSNGCQAWHYSTEELYKTKFPRVFLIKYEWVGSKAELIRGKEAEKYLWASKNPGQTKEYIIEEKESGEERILGIRMRKDVHDKMRQLLM